MLVRHRNVLRAAQRALICRPTLAFMNVREIHITSPLLRAPRGTSSSKDVAELNRINSKLTDQLAALDQMTKNVKSAIKLKESEKVEAEVKKESTSGQLEESQKDEPTEHDIDQIFNTLGISDTSRDDSSKSQALLDSVSSTDDPNLVHTPGTSVVNLDNESELMNLFPAPRPYIEIPLSVKNALTPELMSNITRKETSNWEPIVDTLLKSSICNPVNPETIIDDQFVGFDFHRLVSVIPRNQKAKMVEKLHELALLSGVLWGNVHVMNDLLALCNLMPVEKAKVLVGTLVNDIDFIERRKEEDGEDHEAAEDSRVEIESYGEKIVANITTKAILLNHYARLTDIDGVRKYVEELSQLPDQKNPMKTSPVIYTSIMQMYIRLGNYDLAKQTFDTMKFLSMNTSPSSHTYTSMILMDTLNNNIEHGISVYEEMQEKEIHIEAEALLALAKGCGARRGMVSRGWEFIIRYYESGYPVDGQVMEIMMYLAYVDCDLPFVRGIWMNICETNTKIAEQLQLPQAKCTKWLFNTYYRMGDVHDKAINKGESHVPVGLVDPRVKAIRTKVLELTNYGFHEQAPPLLPILTFDGADPNLILSEARALWTYMLEYHEGRYISEELVEAYLYVVGRYARLETFQNEWDRYTIFDDAGLKKNDGEHKISIEDPEEVETMEVNEDEKRIDAINSNNSTQLPFGRILRNDRLYNMCMHVARHQASLSFAQKIWTERGEFRKGKRFQALKPAQQDEADFKFARLMLSTLTFTGNVGDAYKLVLSSQNRFVWSKYHLKSLMSLCERLGFDTFSKELVKVTKRADKWTRRQQRKSQR
jgi:pentatricopeptide repeat protein